MFSKKNFFYLFLSAVLSSSLWAAKEQKPSEKSHDNVFESLYEIRYPKQVNLLLDQVDQLRNHQAFLNKLAQLTSFRDRAAVHESGRQASMWIFQKLEEQIKQTKRDDISISLIETEGSWPGTDLKFKQPSVIVKMGHSSLPAVIVGAHIDTMASCGETVSCDKFSEKNKKPLPGADDDGSGVVTVMEIARYFFENNMQFKNPIYFMFYAGEEAGYAGSKTIVKEFKKKNLPVFAVMQLDMTGYTCKNDLTMWLHVDQFTNKNLTYYTQKLIQVYVKRKANITSIGIGGSDDIVWGEAGFKTVRPQESKDEFDKECGSLFMHSGEDTIDKLSLTHMIDYLKLALAFTVELAHPLQKSEDN